VDSILTIVPDQLVLPIVWSDHKHYRLNDMQFWLYDILNNIQVLNCKKAGWLHRFWPCWSGFIPKTDQNSRPTNMKYFYKFVSITNSAWISLANLNRFHPNLLRIGGVMGNSLKMLPSVKHCGNRMAHETITAAAISTPQHPLRWYAAIHTSWFPSIVWLVARHRTNTCFDFSTMKLAPSQTNASGPMPNPLHA
jgi:hypothetical protein